MENAELREQYLGDVLHRFYGAPADAEDEEVAREFPFVYWAVTRMRVGELERLLRRAMKGEAHQFSLGSLKAGLVRPHVMHVTEEELAKDLRMGRFQSAFVFGEERIERWRWRAGQVELGDPADAYEPPVRERGKVEPEVLELIAEAGSEASQEPRARLGVAICGDRSGPRFQLLWVYESVLERTAAEALATAPRDRTRAARGRRRRPRERRR